MQDLGTIIMGGLSRCLGGILVLYGMFNALVFYVFGGRVGPGMERLAWWEILGRYPAHFGFCLAMILGGIGLIILPSWLKRRDEINHPKPGPVDDLA